MFRPIRNLIQIVKAGHLAYPILISTGIHTTLLVALGMVVVASAPGPRREAVALAVGLGSNAGQGDGELDATPIALDGDYSSGDGDGINPVSRSDFAATEFEPADNSESDSVDEPLLAPTWRIPTIVCPVLAILAPASDLLGLPRRQARSRQARRLPRKHQRINASPGNSSGKKGSGGGKPGAKGGKNSSGVPGNGAGGSSFFGFSADSERVVFIVDVSGSMHGRRIRRAQTELRHTLESLKPTQKFYIVFFSDGALPMPATALLPATSENVSLAWQWVQQAQCGGGTNPLPALLLALDLKPDTIYLLTDGKFPGQVFMAATQAPPGHRTPIYTIAFASKKAERLLQAIANETGGGYRFVP